MRSGMKSQNGPTGSCPSKATTGMSKCAAMAISRSMIAQMMIGTPSIRCSNRRRRSENDFGSERTIVADMRKPRELPPRRSGDEFLRARLMDGALRKCAQ
jgi:hypothetical protein